MFSITAVISSYGYRDFITQAIDSVLAQTKLPDEILVVDDGAHDGIGEIAKKYGLSYLERPINLGIVNNYNDILFKHIKTAKMFILAADDWLAPQFVELMNLSNADIISSDITLVGEYANRVRKGMKSEFRDGYWIWKFEPEKHNINRVNYVHGSSVYDVELARKEGGYKAMKNRSKKKEEDWGLFRKMINSGAKHVHVSQGLLYYRKHRYNVNGCY